jgi:hypothetical protein
MIYASISDIKKGIVFVKQFSTTGDPAKPFDVFRRGADLQEL